jgi:hypothetical protein
LSCLRCYIKHADERQAQREQEEEEENFRKADMKKLKASNALLNKKLQDERRVGREVEKGEGEGEGKEGSRTGPKETTERAEKIDYKHFKLCTTVPKRQQNNLKETCTQKEVCGGVHYRCKWGDWTRLVRNHPKHHYPKSLEGGATSLFLGNSDSTNQLHYFVYAPLSLSDICSNWLWCCNSLL